MNDLMRLGRGFSLAISFIQCATKVTMIYDAILPNYSGNINTVGLAHVENRIRVEFDPS